MAWTAPRTWVTGEVVTATMMNTHVRDNLLASLGPTVSSVAALNTAWGGTPPDGAKGVIRVGVSPYSHKAVVYDSGLGKWVSDSKTTSWGEGYGISHNTTISTVNSADQLLAGTEDHGLFQQAGLSASVRTLVRMWNDSASSGQFWLNVLHADADSNWVDPAAQFFNTTFRAWTATPTFLAAAVDDLTSEWHTLAATYTGALALGFYGSIQSSASPNFTTTHADSLFVTLRYTS